jgi:DNA-binding NarL/FixJ family response regulator
MAATHSVVLVEDDPVTRTRIGRVVDGHPQLRLAAALGTVAAARAALERELPDVLLTDIDLPDGSGVELIAWLRERNAATAPMVVSVFGDEQHVVEAIEAGAPRGQAPQLSPREQEVLNLIAKGFSYAEIAGLLGLTPPTVATHTRGIYRKLDVHSRGEAVYEALQLGLVKP